MTPPCPICGAPRSMTWRRVNKTCGKRPCFIELRRRQCIGKVPVKAHQMAKAQRDARMQQVVRIHVGGLLTDRDRRLWAVVWKYAWIRGYHAGAKRARTAA